MLTIENPAAALTAPGFKTRTGLFDLEGDDCFASGLIHVAANRASINATLMRNIKVPVPPLSEQKRRVAKVCRLEQQKSDAQAVIATVPARQQAILRCFL